MQRATPSPLGLVARQAVWFALGALGAGIVLAGLWFAIRQTMTPEQLGAIREWRSAHRGPVLLGGIALLAAAGGLCVRFYRRYPLTLARMADDLALMVRANQYQRLEIDGGRPIRALAASIDDLSAQYRAQQTATQQRVADATASLEQERNRLAALMSELDQAVIVCNLEGRILLYNQRARALFATETDAGLGGLIGLGRSVFGLIPRETTIHAMIRLRECLVNREAGSDALPQAITMTVPLDDGRLFRTRCAPVLRGEQAELAGLVLLLEDVSASVRQSQRRLHLLHSLTETSRSGLGSIRAAVENLIEFPDMSGAQRQRFTEVIGEEARGLGDRIDGMLREYADSIRTQWPLEEMRAADLLNLLAQTLKREGVADVRVDEADPELWLTADSYALSLALLSMIETSDPPAKAAAPPRLRATAEGEFVHLDLLWAGEKPRAEQLTQWESAPIAIEGASQSTTVRDVVERHGGELWAVADEPSGEAGVRILLRPTSAPRSLPPETESSIESRPEFYDFDLFGHLGEHRELENRPLESLSFTVFDTETTGLDTDRDEIISIGALRIVNGRVLQSEVFEHLVDPGRSIPRESLSIHGISDEMVAGRPRIGEVLPAFHRFCEDTVLVAHNAAFDMSMLARSESRARVHFDHPVLDTLLLSAVVYPQPGRHDLESIAKRFEIPIVGRHTALGDAIVTAHVFVHLLRLLRDQGITTLGEALRAAQQTYLARVRY